MIRNHTAKLVLLVFVLSLALASCNLPSVTPPGQATTEGPTSTFAPTATIVLPSATPTPAPETLTRSNIKLIRPVNVAPATDLIYMGWSSDGSSLGTVSQNMDANNNAIYTATFLDMKLNIKYLMSSSNGDIFVHTSPDGHEVAAISSDGNTATMYDLADGNKAVTQISPGFRVYSVTFSPDGQTFSLTDGDNMAVDLYTLSKSSDPYPLSGFTTAAPVFDVGFTGNGSTLVWHSRATLQLQDIATKKMGPSFDHEDFVTAFTLSPDGKILASAAAKTVDGDEKPVVELWDTVAGTESKLLVMPQATMSLSFSPDSSLLAAATGSEVQIFDVASDTLLNTLTAHSGTVNLVAFSPDGKSLTSYGQDNQLMLWQVIPAQ